MNNPSDCWIEIRIHTFNRDKLLKYDIIESGITIILRYRGRILKEVASIEKAQSEYGVVINKETLAVDLEATQKLREGLLKRRV